MAVLLLAGATGLVGESVLRQALADSRVSKVVAITRKPLPPQDGLENPLVDFDALPEDAPWWNVDAGICTLGTTMRQAGSHQAFRKVDVDYPLAVARLLHQHGAKSFAFNSSIGANPKARAFYMRVKGEVEQRLIAGGFPSLTLCAPRAFWAPANRIVPGRRAPFEFFIPCGRFFRVTTGWFLLTRLPKLCSRRPSPHLLEYTS